MKIFLTEFPNWTEEYSTGNSTFSWVYRGPNTTPNNSVGSQEACGTTGTIQSPSPTMVF